MFLNFYTKPFSCSLYLLFCQKTLFPPWKLTYSIGFTQENGLSFAYTLQLWILFHQISFNLFRPHTCYCIGIGREATQNKNHVTWKLQLPLQTKATSLPCFCTHSSVVHTYVWFIAVSQFIHCPVVCFTAWSLSPFIRVNWRPTDLLLTPSWVFSFSFIAYVCSDCFFLIFSLCWCSHWFLHCSLKFTEHQTWPLLLTLNQISTYLHFIEVFPLLFFLWHKFFCLLIFDSLFVSMN